MDRAIDTVSTVIRHAAEKFATNHRRTCRGTRQDLSKNELYRNGNGLLVSYMIPYPSNCSLHRCYYPLLQKAAKMTKAQKPLLQVERMVQQAQLEMRALLLHLRPAALNNKSLAEGLEELLVELREKVLFDIRFRLEEVTLSKGAEDHLIPYCAGDIIQHIAPCTSH